jgi:hypothetical protein
MVEQGGFNGGMKNQNQRREKDRHLLRQMNENEDCSRESID